MSKLPVLTPKEIVAIPERNGFVLIRTKGSHAIYHNPNTRKMVVVPMHKTDLPKGTTAEILKQAGIGREEPE